MISKGRKKIRNLSFFLIVNQIPLSFFNLSMQIAFHFNIHVLIHGEHLFFSRLNNTILLHYDNMLSITMSSFFEAVSIDCIKWRKKEKERLNSHMISEYFWWKWNEQIVHRKKNKEEKPVSEINDKCLYLFLLARDL